MPNNNVCIQSTNPTMMRHTLDSPPQVERRRGSVGNKDAGWEARYQRAARIMEADRQRTAEFSRPAHCCAMMNVIADHAIQTVASYLTPRDRMNLRHAAWRFEHALQADAAIDRLTMKIAKVVTPSLLRRALAEIDRYPAARPSLIALLPERVQHFCPPHCQRALQLILEAIERLPAEQRVVALEKTGPLLREETFDFAIDCRQQSAIQNLVAQAIQRLPVGIRARPLAAVLNAGRDHPSTRVAKARGLLAGIHAYPPGVRAAMLLALIHRFDHRAGIPDQGLWHKLLQSTLELPIEYQAEPLRALASHPRMPLSLAEERWDDMMELSATLSERSQAALYSGLAGNLMRLPSIKCEPGTRRRFDRLNSAIGGLAGRYQPAVLEALCGNILRAGFGEYWDGIVSLIKSLPRERQFAPLRALARDWRTADGRHVAPHCSATLLEAVRDLAAEDRAVLLGDFARKVGGTTKELNDLLDACLDLPLALRRWTLAGLASKACWVLADNATPIQQIFLPMIASMDASHRVPVLAALLQTAFNSKETDPRDTPTRYMPAATWLALEGSFHALPPDLREQVLLKMARRIKNPMTPAWNWVLRATRKLPASNQPEVLWQLASADYLIRIPSDVRQTRMVTAAIAALPKHFRAMPLWAAQRAHHNADDNPLNIVRYFQCNWAIFRQEHSLPEEDKW